MLFSEDNKHLQLVHAVIQRTINGSDLFGVIEEFQYTDFSDINKILNSLISNNYLMLKDEKLSLTDSGCIFLKNLNKRLGYKGIYRYILTYPTARIECLDIDKPYIPHRKQK